MSLLPSRPDASPAEDAGPRVVGVDSEDADAVLSALSSETARELLAAVHDDPAPPSELAERVDTSLQNAQYHLENLEDAGAVEVVDTAYSAKGREMDVYAAADQPLVIFAGDEEDSSVLRTAIQRLVGALGLLALASLAVQAIFGRIDLLGGADLGAQTGGEGDGAGGGGDAGAVDGGDGGDGGGGGDVDVTGDGAGETTQTPTPEG
ncbi:ArsR family transcriptional regulator, partial [Halobacteriales archaeon SW_10_68_16]